MDIIKSRVKEILKTLRRLYPEPETALHHKNALEMLVATILSAQCTDARVNLVTPALFRKYPHALAYAEADLQQLEKDLSSINFFRNKAKNIQATGRLLVEKYKGEVPQTMEELIELPGVGRKTANVVLGVIHEKAEGVVVDTHVKRLSYRLGLTKKEEPHRIELDLIKIVPQNSWIDFSHLLILHGRAICKARRPLCEECGLNPVCPKKGV